MHADLARDLFQRNPIKPMLGEQNLGRIEYALDRFRALIGLARAHVLSGDLVHANVFRACHGGRQAIAPSSGNFIHAHDSVC